MDLRSGHIGQFWQPVLHVATVRVVVLRLLENVEKPEAPRIVADASGVVPVAPVAAHVVVDQQGLEPLCAHVPVDAQIFGQEAGHVLAAAIGHEARGGQLSHIGVHEGKARFAARPQLEARPVFFPRDLDALEPRCPKDLVAVLETDKAEIVAPQQLKDQPVGGVVGGAIVFVGEHLVVDVAGGETAEGQPRRELGGIVGPQHAVAGFFVDAEAIALPKIVLEPRQARRLAPPKGQNAPLVWAGRL